MNRVKFKYEQELFQLEVKLWENRKPGLLKYECLSMRSCVRCANVVTLTLLYSSDYRIYEERGLGHLLGKTLLRKYMSKTSKDSL